MKTIIYGLRVCLLSGAILTMPLGHLFAQGPNVSGFIDVGYNYNFNKPINHTNDLRVFDRTHNNFTIQAAEIVWEGTSNNVDYRIDVDYGSDAAGTQSAGFTNAALQIDLQQAYITAPCPTFEKGHLTAGKWATLLGREVIESGNNDNFSRSYLFGYSIPFTHTGVKYDYKASAKHEFALGVVNGWDNLTDNNKSKSFIGGLGFTPSDSLSFYLAGIYGPETGQEGSGKGAVTLSADLTVSEKLTLKANGVYGSEEGASALTPGDESTWMGVAAYAVIRLCEKNSIALRYENFDDTDGSQLGLAANEQGTIGGQVVNELTLTFQNKKDSMIKRLEWRHDLSNRQPFIDDKGMTQDSQSIIAFEMILTF